ncbi:DsbE family thiol:disulfide interchange protein [Sandarakinorhabdus oryzae]|uniref:DsbE family thiol:disulfide interchange protein n=1 Tax=Sandarakinorhabdus oryzae TaxID=2675220 RepID=UPI0012E28563|nr:DsbE family thiol:disulfide interchange protein [Sandarakinorhabdus oryzae]
MRKLVVWMPFGVVAVLLATFAAGLLNPSDRAVASGMVGRTVPAFRLAGVRAPDQGLETGYFADGKPRLLNIFASWCGPCVAEAPVLMDLQRAGVEITGIAVHDRADDLRAFLARRGNPYSRIGMDPEGRAQIAFGSAGVPETFVVNGRGTIVYQHIGIITANDVPIILAKLRRAG